MGDVSKVEDYSEAGIAWMETVLDAINKDDEIDKARNVSWAVFHAGNEPHIKKVLSSQILPVFTEASNIPAMVKHCLAVIMNAHAIMK